MNSPDDRFQQRIDEAARSLARRAAGARSAALPDPMLDAIRARCRDLDASIETAARSLAGPAPLDGFDVRIAAAARELRKPAPAALGEQLLAGLRSSEAPPRPVAWTSRRHLVLLRNVVALAATLLLAATLISRLARDAVAAPGSALLTSAALAQSQSDEARLDREAERIAARVDSDATLASNEVAQSLLEEVAFLDQALAECRQALAVSQAHGHLREQLVELTGQRVDLLRQVEAAGQ